MIGLPNKPIGSKDSLIICFARMPLNSAPRNELGTNPKAHIQETVERVEKIIEALDSQELSRAEKSSVQQYKEKLRAHTQKTLYDLIAIL